MISKHKGSCLCGEIQFEIEGSFEKFFICHCKFCQKDTGSAYAANLFSTTATLKWLSGKDMVKEYHLPSTLHVKSFCARCSSAMPSLQKEGALLMVPAGSLDTPVLMTPMAHIFCSSQPPWNAEDSKIPQFPRFPE